MALVGNPELLILDEPANGLDPAGIVDLRHLLRRLAGHGITVLVSSHQLAEVQQACDDLVVMAGGRVIASGTTEGLLRRHQGAGAVEIDVAAGDLPRAASALAVLGDITADGATLAVTTRPGVTGRDLNQALFDAGVVAERLQHRTKSLEDVFLDLTANPTATPTETATPTMENDR
jgi:ABC-2 type transport system ATP-binding protein